MANREFRHNHYVPEWYQRRFLPAGLDRFFYLDMKPETVERDGHRYVRRSVMQWGPSLCFAENDLYTVKWGNWENTDIEKFFFGKFDNSAPRALDYFSNFENPSANEKAFHTFLTYMSVQKLRTPKGLAWLQFQSKSRHRNLDLIFLQRIQNIFCALWTECIWQIADAENSPTKFIISDHPVVTYNRWLPPGSSFAGGFNDPDIRMVATHTYFPLRSDRILILTNLAWIRNPYQRETNIRPNPKMFRQAMFNFTDIQTYRSLSEDEVLKINHVTKQSAGRYIAAAERSWLFPEEYIRPQKWDKIGRGLLFMPDPREIYMGGEIVIGYKDGSADAFSEYGHRPWQRGFKDQERFEKESRALDRFKAEFAVMQGPKHRGSSFGFHRSGPHEDSPDFFQHYVERANPRAVRKGLKKPTTSPMGGARRR